MESILYNESVELIVYFVGGSRKTYTRINNTPHKQLYTLEQYMTMHVMNGFCLSPCMFEFARFPTRDKDETLSSNMSATFR